MSDTDKTLPRDYSLEEVAAALGMSERWVRNLIAAGKENKGPVIEHIRRGHKIKFTEDQYLKLRAHGSVKPDAAESITTGPKKSRR
jgi:biotin operon repressor